MTAEYDAFRAMEARAYLDTVRASAVECKALAVVCEELAKMMPGGSMLSDKVRSSTSNDATEKVALRLYEAKEAHETALAAFVDMHGEAVDAILKLDDPRHRAVMMSYYVAGLEWQEVGDRLHYSPDWCRQLRDEALPMIWHHIPRSAKTMVPRAD